MQKNGIFIAAVITSIAAASLFLFPAIYTKRECSQLHITATTSIIADAITQIAGDKVVIKTLMGPGIDPHSYHARLSDMHALMASDIVLYNGLHLEGKMANILDKMQAYKPTYAITKKMSEKKFIKSNEFDGIYDPHIWFDVKLWMQVVGYITDILCKHDKTNATFYQKNSNAYIKQLEQLDTWINNQINTTPKNKRFLVTTHDAFSYFGRAYDLRVIALQGINLDAEPCIMDMQQLVHIICSYNIPTIFVESSLPHRSMQAICKAVHAQGQQVNIGDELYSDALGSIHSNAHTYIDMCKHNVNAVVKGLNSL